MNVTLLKDLVDLVADFESQDGQYTNDIHGFRRWVFDGMKHEARTPEEPEWDGKQSGRSPESVINTLIVHMNRYARTYSKAAITDSAFSTQEEFIYLINLKAFGAMTKMELIKKNVQDKPAGIQIINRLIQQGWALQTDSATDKRSKIIKITEKGLHTLEQQMDKIRIATRIVTGDLIHPEKMELIRLLQKLDAFHQPVFMKNTEPEKLLDMVMNEYLPAKQQREA